MVVHGDHQHLSPYSRKIDRFSLPIVLCSIRKLCAINPPLLDLHSFIVGWWIFSDQPVNMKKSWTAATLYKNTEAGSQATGSNEPFFSCLKQNYLHQLSYSALLRFQSSAKFFIRIVWQQDKNWLMKKPTERIQVKNKGKIIAGKKESDIFHGKELCDMIHITKWNRSLTHIGLAWAQTYMFWLFAFFLI